MTYNTKKTALALLCFGIGATQAISMTAKPNTIQLAQGVVNGYGKVMKPLNLCRPCSPVSCKKCIRKCSFSSSCHRSSKSCRPCRRRCSHSSSRCSHSWRSSSWGSHRRCRRRLRCRRSWSRSRRCSRSRSNRRRCCSRSRSSRRCSRSSRRCSRRGSRSSRRSRTRSCRRNRRTRTRSSRRSNSRSRTLERRTVIIKEKSNRPEVLRAPRAGSPLRGRRRACGSRSHSHDRILANSPLVRRSPNPIKVCKVKKVCKNFTP